MRKPLDLSGQIFGELTALYIVGKSRDNQMVWLCRCSCGADKRVSSRHLRNGMVRSCGHLVQIAERKRAKRGAMTIKNEWAAKNLLDKLGRLGIK